MKLALVQLNYHIGNFEENSKKIIHHIQKAKDRGVDLVAFSELAICGYPPLDLLTRQEFVEAAIRSIEEIATYCNGIAAVVGGPSLNPLARGKQLHNSAWFLADGEVKEIIHKTLLPNYDVFDEYRYFQANQDFRVVNYKGRRIALTICEDLWDDQPTEAAFARNSLYTLSPMQKLAALKADFMVNIAASPFSYHQENVRKQVVCKKAAGYKVPVAYVNQVGANTELIFDGGSMMVNSEGNITHKVPTFREGWVDVETDDVDQETTNALVETDPIELIHDGLILGVRDYFRKSGLKKAVIGLSGGIDSAVTAAVAVKALGAENVHGVLLPSQYSSGHSVTDAEKLAENLGIEINTVAIKEIYESVENALSPVFEDREPDVTEENIQARIRGLLLMAYSNKFGHILLNTSNKSEAAVGYGTLYGDMNGGLSVLGDVYKTDVFKLARYFNRNGEMVPENTIVKPPSAELRPDQKDSDSLPDYDVLDSVLFRYIELNHSPKSIIEEGFKEEVVRKAVRLVNFNEYKRFQTPPILRVSGKAFGVGRRMPLVAKYDKL
ncbi:NAD+ synthase [Marinilabilia rubra]|uniref:Glutamine-dependent NAD(+) synthetase n=1 Tax=Marinilabilia rubra TaxID=2162893 RepID=A0A2U2B8B9_9BACT|nr:NAD+ synthase [Marinilabilia rubra]PWD99310.1 NAD+ synthase [Marinilabilia rubra]